jgi:acyl-coenzyme A synthetase/AMP-(fatty) acid ligase
MRLKKKFVEVDHVTPTEAHVLSFQHVFGYEPGDIFSCVADIGWITGHSYVVYGPLSNGATSVMFESIPTYPDPGRYWETVERLKINQFYGAPTAIRLLLKYEVDWVKKYDRSSLRVLGTGRSCSYMLPVSSSVASPTFNPTMQIFSCLLTGKTINF